MGRNIKLYRDYYDTGVPLYQRSNIELKPGLTVLVGCNGAGKTTMLHQLKQHLQKNDVPYVFFDNLMDGGANARQQSLWDSDISFLATAAVSSEGENIVMNMGKLAERLGTFIRTGEDSKGINANRLAKALLKSAGKDTEEEKTTQSNERWVLLDAVDSGLSVDNIVDLKEFLFKTMQQHAAALGLELYIVVSANEYEMARGEHCFDVYRSRYTEIPTYESYRNLILDSRKQKDKRYDKMQKQKEKEEINEEEEKPLHTISFTSNIASNTTVDDVESDNFPKDLQLTDDFTETLSQALSQIKESDFKFFNADDVSFADDTVSKITHQLQKKESFSLDKTDSTWTISTVMDMEDYEL